MTRQEVQFRSKRDRDRDVPLEKNYRQIGCPAIAAASHAMRKQKQMPQQQQQPQAQASAAPSFMK